MLTDSEGWTLGHYCWAGDTLQVLHDIAAHRNVGTRDHARAAAVTVDAATRSVNRVYINIVILSDTIYGSHILRMR